MVAGHKARQAVYASDGETLVEGDWNPKVLARYFRSEDIAGARVLDIGCSTGGLTLELARMGGDVLGIDPDPYGHAFSLSKDIIAECGERENLTISFENADLFSAHNFGQFDVIVCFGLLYHFRQPQFVLDYLSSLAPKVLYLSCQTHAGEECALYNRAGPGMAFPAGHFDKVRASGWHPTRPLLERMIEWAGFGDIEAVSPRHINFPQKPPGATNSAYYRARLLNAVDAEAELRRYYPR